MNAYIQSVGVYLPDNIVTNDDLSKFVDTNDEWIRTRSGIQERRILKDETIRTADMAAFANPAQNQLPPTTQSLQAAMHQMHKILTKIRLQGLQALNLRRNNFRCPTQNFLRTRTILFHNQMLSLI